ncbi:methyl-accepting chemotaxis protein [Aquibacillus rhizosphaerae]|uniref:Methyl-accepting chemotaxis protein n=1 Tax=Aquibacillus rhizosphaerae TaxID=3051431 RepID=A0ABT7L4A8_9BACI|nr:methyl-accepting chemotaxis protein [Aquibacillus sp. LR5S19]MDL4840684.1 methyl-accepting chemotaxis protein [Aquibacillus sp. LR5S19]
MIAFSKLSDLSLRTRLIIVFLTVLLWVAIANCVLIFLFVGYVREYNDMMKTITLTNAINGELKLQLDDEIREIVYGKVSFENGSQYALLNSMNSNLNQIESDDSLGQFDEEISEVRQSLSTTKEYVDKLGEEIKYNLPADQRNITYEYITIITDIVDDQVQKLLHSTLEVSEQSKTNIVDNIKRDITVYVVAFIAVILLSILFAWYISGNIVKPIHRLRQNANEIAEGNLTVDAVVIPSKNEIGDLCRSYNRMSNNLKDIIVSVRSTNDLVMLSSKDIHHSIQENRFAGEEVANATQTISMNLHEQDELIKQAVSTYDDLIIKYEQILSKSIKIQLHSNKSLELANQGSLEVDKLVNQNHSIKSLLHQVDNESQQLTQTVSEVDKSLNIMKLIAREANLLSYTMSNLITNETNQKELTNITERIEQLANEANITTQDSEITESRVQKHKNNISEKLKEAQKDIISNQQVVKIGESFESIYAFNRNVQSEINNVTEDMQSAFEHMDHVRNVIRDIEHRSKISKSEVISIASMGEEQLATLEEVSESSYKLVERIQKMKNDIRQFKV